MKFLKVLSVATVVAFSNMTFPALMVMSSYANAETEEQLMARFADAIQDAGKYALTEMRPTARFSGASVERVRASNSSDGGDIKARVATRWVTAFTGKDRLTVTDVWLTVASDGIYLTRYKLYSDNHNIPITTPQDARLKVRLDASSSGGGSSRSDNF